MFEGDSQNAGAEEEVTQKVQEVNKKIIGIVDLYHAQNCRSARLNDEIALLWKCYGHYGNYRHLRGHQKELFDYSFKRIMANTPGVISRITYKGGDP